MIRVGMIGKGIISREHDAAYKQLIEDGKEFSVDAYCDIRESQLEGLPGRLYTDVDTFLREEAGKLDFVDICLPTYLHAEVSIKAMNAGFNVMCEKPMARTYEQALEMIRVSEKTGKLLMIAHSARFIKLIDVIEETIKSGELGKVHTVECWREGGSRNPMGYQNWFRNGKLSGGAMLDLHVHDVDRIVYFFGKPKTVSTFARSIMTSDGGYDAIFSNMRCEGDVLVSIRTDWSIAHNKFNSSGIRVNFDNGYIFSDSTGGRSATVKVDAEGNVTDLAGLDKRGTKYNEILYFAEHLQSGEPLVFNNPYGSADNIRVVMAEIESADNGGKVVEL